MLRKPGAAISNDHFQGHGSVCGREPDHLWALLNECAGITTASMQIYMDVVDGDDDANDGQTSSTPVKTLQGALDVLPHFIAHDIAINVDGGQEALTANVYIDKHIMRGVSLVIDGGDDWTDTGGGTYTSTSAAVGSITAAAVGSADANAGYIIDILTGDAAGDMRMCQINSTTVATPTKNFSADPDVSGAATFRVVRPTNGWSRGTSALGIYMQPQGEGSLYFQRLYLSGTHMYLGISPSSEGGVSSPNVVLSAVVNGSTLATPAGFREGRAIATSSPLNPATFAAITDLAAGYSQLTGTATIDGMDYVSLYDSYFRGMSMINSKLFAFDGGSRVKGDSAFVNCQMALSGTGIKNTAGYAPTTFDNCTASGLAFSGKCDLTLGAMEINTCASHAIEADDSRLLISGVIATAGGSVTGAALFAHNGARVETTSGTTVTATGTVGEISFDGVYEMDTWANMVITPYEYAGTWVGLQDNNTALLKVLSISPKGAARIYGFIEEETTLSLIALGTDTTALFPTDAFNRAVSCLITEEITGGGVTGVTVGDGTTPDVFAAAFSALTLGGNAKGVPASDASVVLTNTAVTFTASHQVTAGKVRILMSWEDIRLPQA